MTSTHVRVPASTSNLGGGFDCVGIAVDRWLRVHARIDAHSADAVRITRRGALCVLTGPAADDLIYRGFTIACGAAGREVPRGVVFDAESEIPVGRGLGSSAAALLAGAAAASSLLSLALPDETLAKLCAEAEGHADNVGPCLLGGAVFATLAGPGGLVLAPISVHGALRLVFAIPDFGVDTHLARAALPTSVAHTEARLAIAASAALVLGLERGDRRLLALGLEGPLHVPQRRPLVRGYEEVVGAARNAGAIGATLSGSGSAIVAVADARNAEAVGAAMVDAWSVGGTGAIAFASAPCAAGLEVRPGDGSDNSAGGPAEHSEGSHISSVTR